MANSILSALQMLEGEIDHQSHIIRGIKRLALDGTIRPGDRLPAVLETAGYFSLSPVVVTLAYKQLARDGYVAIMLGKGGQVCKGIVSDPPKENLHDR
jgi:DNA-binding transcriptional regulator YhcF (GntR family)